MMVSIERKYVLLYPRKATNLKKNTIGNLIGSIIPSIVGAKNSIIINKIKKNKIIPSPGIHYPKKLFHSSKIRSGFSIPNMKIGSKIKEHSMKKNKEKIIFHIKPKNRSSLYIH